MLFTHLHVFPSLADDLLNVTGEDTCAVRPRQMQPAEYSKTSPNEHVKKYSEVPVPIASPSPSVFYDRLSRRGYNPSSSRAVLAGPQTPKVQIIPQLTLKDFELGWS